MESPTTATRWPFLRMKPGAASLAEAPVKQARVSSARAPVSLRIVRLLLLSEYLTHIREMRQQFVGFLAAADRGLEDVQRGAQAQRPRPALRPRQDHARPHRAVGDAIDDDEGARGPVLLVGVEG